MQRLNGVIFDTKPEDVMVYPSCVDVLVSCKETEVRDEMSGESQMKFLCDVERYEVHEYIQKLQAENVTLGQQLSDTQLALCDVYEMLI